LDYVNQDALFDLTVYTFGKTCAPLALLEDDFETYEYLKGSVAQYWLEYDIESGPGERRHGPEAPQRYRIREWRHVAR
jgi:hypothetical protein